MIDGSVDHSDKWPIADCYKCVIFLCRCVQLHTPPFVSYHEPWRFVLISPCFVYYLILAAPTVVCWNNLSVQKVWFCLKVEADRQFCKWQV